MPPANSPTGTPPTQPPPYLPQLDSISRPVPDLASTRSPPFPTIRGLQDDTSMTDLRSALSQAAPVMRRSRIDNRQISDPPDPHLSAVQSTESRRRAYYESVSRHLSANSYSNRAPTRQSLYDWATVADESEADRLRGSRFRDEMARRLDQHETAISESMRRQLEPRDEPSGRIRLPPVRNRSPSEEEREEQIARLSEHGRSPSVTAALSRLIERQRIERRERRWEREHVVESGRADEQTGRVARQRALRELRSRERFAQMMDSRHRLRPPTMPKTVNLIKYLANLRDCSSVTDALSLANTYSIPTLFSPQSDTCPSDLTLSANGLNSPQPSSFLTSGTVFDGLQQTPREAPVVLLNRDRDYLRRMVANRNLNFSSTNLPGSLAQLLASDSDDQAASENPTSTGNLSIPTASQARSSENQGSRSRTSHRATPAQTPPSKESWPVRVSIHSVSFESMTLIGTMCASHIPDKLSTDSPDHRPDGCSMESFFEGEIIDFNKFSLETGNERFKSGGVEVDARHWRGVGPFRQIANALKKRKCELKSSTGRSTSVDQSMLESKTSSTGQDELTYEEEEELEAETDDEFARSLSSTKWLNDQLNDWVLMRWKERCFINLPPGTSASDRYGNILPGRPGGSSTATVTSAITANGCSYGLTISGYYYIALERSTGKIEGLYFDPGSQPYQELWLKPEGSQTASEDKADLTGEKMGDDTASTLDSEATDEKVDGVMDVSMDGIGRKKWFPSVEFR